MFPDLPCTCYIIYPKLLRDTLWVYIDRTYTGQHVLSSIRMHPGKTSLWICTLGSWIADIFRARHLQFWNSGPSFMSCNNKVPPFGWLNNGNILSHCSGEVWQDCFLVGAARERSFPVFFFYMEMTDFSLSLHICSPPCVSLLVSNISLFVRTSVVLVYVPR